MSRGHHLLFQKNNWSGHKPNMQLRCKPGLIIPIERNAHDALHKEVATVPTPSYLLGAAALQIYRDNPDNYLRSVDNLLFAFEEASRHPRVRHVERRLGELICVAIEEQIPFIREGLDYGQN